MSIDYAHNATANAQRVAKADRIAVQLRTEGIPAAAARDLPPRARRRIERAAGSRVASDETWAMAIAFLTDHEQAHPVRVDPDNRDVVVAILTWALLNDADHDPEVSAAAATALTAILGHRVLVTDVADAATCRRYEDACRAGGDDADPLIDGHRGSRADALDLEAERWATAHADAIRRIVTP